MRSPATAPAPVRDGGASGCHNATADRLIWTKEHHLRISLHASYALQRHQHPVEVRSFVNPTTSKNAPAADASESLHGCRWLRGGGRSSETATVSARRSQAVGQLLIMQHHRVDWVEDNSHKHDSGRDSSHNSDIFRTLTAHNWHSIAFSRYHLSFLLLARLQSDQQNLHHIYARIARCSIAEQLD